MSYTAWVALFGLAGLGWVLWRGCRSLADVADALAQVFFIGLAALVCGRIGYALLNLDFFAQKPGAVWSASYPGLAEQTALLGACVAWRVFAVQPRRLANKIVEGKNFMRQPARLSEASFILLAALVGIGASVGCMQAGCAYGREVFWQDGANSIGWLLRADLPDAYSIPNPRWPTQAMMAVGLSLEAGLLGFGMARNAAFEKSGFLTVTLFCALFLAGDFLIQFLRADPGGEVMFGLRGSQWLDVASAGLVLLACFVTMRLAHKLKNQSGCQSDRQSDCQSD